MDPFDVYLARHPWQASVDERPWLLVRPAADGAWDCFPISTKDYGDPTFEVPAGDADFAATGLRATSYVHDFHLVTLPRSAFIKRWGRMKGDLLARFRHSSGL